MNQEASRMPVAACLLAVVGALILAACKDSGPPTVTPTPIASSGPPLSLADWAEQVCALSVEAADTLDVPGPDDPETLTLANRKQRAAEILAPRAAALAGTAQKLAGMQPPKEVEEDAGTFPDLHRSLQMIIADVASAWQELVDAAEEAQSAEELNAANGVFIRAGNALAVRVDIHNAWLVSDETRAALSQPKDCGILNDETGSCPRLPSRPCSLRPGESTRA